MATTSCAPFSRSALSNLDVNSFSTPTKSTPLAKESTSRKRRIDEVDESGNLKTARKALLSPAVSNRDMMTIHREEASAPAPIYLASPSATNTDELPTNEDHPAMALSMDVQTPIKDAPSPHSTASSVVDYDLDDTMESQQTAATELTQPVGLVAQQAGQLSRVSQHAETLRLRLRLAQFKIQTNQTSIPFSQLRLSPTSSTIPHHLANLGHSDDEHEPTLPRLLLPAADLSYARPISSMRGAVIPAPDPSSSPRRSESPEKDAFRTPALPRHVQIRGDGQEDENLTSSGVKGNAAMGLLGLRGERYTAMNSHES